MVLGPGQEGDPSRRHGTEVVTATHSSPTPTPVTVIHGRLHVASLPQAEMQAQTGKGELGLCVLLSEHVGASYCWCPSLLQ